MFEHNTAVLSASAVTVQGAAILINQLMSDLDLKSFWAVRILYHLVEISQN